MATSVSGRSRAKRDQDLRDKAWRKQFQDYVPRSIREHLDRAKELAVGRASTPYEPPTLNDLSDEDKLQIALSGAPDEWLAGLYGIARSAVRRLRRREAYFNRSNKVWRGADNRLGPGLDAANSAISILKRTK